MKEIANQLLGVIHEVLPLLKIITEAEASDKPRPGSWSAKEIIGHLIDSAGNNQQKIIRCIETDGLHFPNYAQDFWVATQQYNSLPWQQLLGHWEIANVHLAHLIAHIPANTLSHTIKIDHAGPFTLEFIVKDYPEHLKHHLATILPGTDFLENTFKMVY